MLSLYISAEHCQLYDVFISSPLNDQEYCFFNLMSCQSPILEFVGLCWLDNRLCVGTNLICSKRTLRCWPLPVINLRCCPVLGRSVEFINCLSEVSSQQFYLLQVWMTLLYNYSMLYKCLCSSRVISLSTSTLTTNNYGPRQEFTWKENSGKKWVVFIISSTL